MRFTGVRPDGTEIQLGNPREAMLSFDREAPAMELKAVFAVEKPWDELSEVLVMQERDGIFRGIVDEQITGLSNEGLTVELICRSREALLLDNEAEPGTIRGPSLEALRRRFLMALGFENIIGQEGAFRGVLNIEKGSSCWRVLSDFCKKNLMTQPWVSFDRALHCEKETPERGQISGVIWAELHHLPVKRLSQVYKQGYGGGYNAMYRDPKALAVRRRYISAQSGIDPKELLRIAGEKSFRITVVCKGNLFNLRRAELEVDLPKAGRFTGCRAERVIYYRDQEGERTKFVLKRGENNVAD